MNIKFDFFAEYYTNKYENKVDDVPTMIKLLAGEAAKDKYKDIIKKKEYDDYIARNVELLKEIGILPYNLLPPNLPNYSLLLRLKLSLTKPYISKDDETFYICDNPIKKDKVFKIPIVSSPTWKGNLRFAGIKFVEQESTNKLADRLALFRLFGHENNSEKKFLDEKMTEEQKVLYEKEIKKYTDSGLLQGRLNFFPTYFDKIGLEIINPHDRTKRVGRNPIDIECVPINAKGDFYLLYVPFNLFVTTNQPNQEVANDIDVLKKALNLMFNKFGFGAKKKAGFGATKQKCIKIYIKDTTIKDTFKDLTDIVNMLKQKEIK